MCSSSLRQRKVLRIPLAKLPKMNEAIAKEASLETMALPIRPLVLPQRRCRPPDKRQIARRVSKPK